MPSVMEYQPETAELGEVDRRSSAYIRWVQESLNRIGGASLRVDGAIGGQTRNAIRAFQGRHGLPTDGVVGPKTEAALIAAGASAPPGSGAPTPRPGPAPGPAGFGTPALLKQESEPPERTLYLDIRLGGESPAQPMTGVFLPAGFQPTERVDLILYLHGHHRGRPRLSIDGYWDRRQFPQWALREGLNQSGKNAVLVAPTLGPTSQAGRLVQPGGFDAYLDAVMAALAAHGPHRGRDRPRVGHVILACHSGGGYPMRQIATSRQRYTPQIRECWGFDCLYNRGDETIWAGWARSRPEARLYVYYLDSTAEKSLALRRLGVPNVSVERSSRGHDWVPINHWAARLAGAPFLTTRSGGDREEWEAPDLNMQRDVIDPRIDVSAQRALIQMASGNLADVTAAFDVLEMVKTGRVRGIYQPQQRVPALVAQRFGMGWWQLLEPGEQSALWCDPRQPAAGPLFVFRKNLSRPRLIQELRTLAAKKSILANPAVCAV